MNSLFKNNLTFVGIGAPRCGTTWVAQCLNEHPEIFVPEVKETSFFSRYNRYIKGIEQYRKYFTSAGDASIWGEFSTEYFTHPEVAERILAVNPNVKILVCLRHPVERCFSHYLYSRRTTLRGKSLQYAIETGHYIVRCSFYYRNLSLFLKTFPPENVHISIMEEAAADPKKYIQSIYRFLGAQADFVPESLLRRINASEHFYHRFLIIHRIYMLRLNLRERWWWDGFSSLGKTLGLQKLIESLYEWNIVDKERSKIKQPVLSPHDREILRTMLYEDVQDLERYLNRDLSLWDMKPPSISTVV
jgi:Sulfotransferase domain